MLNAAEVLYLRRAKDEAEEGAMRNELYAPPDSVVKVHKKMGRPRPAPRPRSKPNVSEIQKMLLDMEREEKTFSRGR